MLEYCSVVYKWKGYGFTQEISEVSINGEELIEWEGKYWTNFLNYMATKGWEFVATAPLGFGADSSGDGIVAYFKKTV